MASTLRRLLKLAYQVSSVVTTLKLLHRALRRLRGRAV
jgi:hypothetical protein